MRSEHHSLNRARSTAQASAFALITKLDTDDTKSRAGDIGLILKACRTPVVGSNLTKERKMHKTTFAAIAVGSLVLAGIAGWAYPNNRPFEAKASASIEAQIDTFRVMSDAKNLPTEEYQDFSLVFSSPAQTRHP